MMSPDDEPIQTPDKGQKTNNLINEAFNLSASLSNFQPLTVLPPSSNHFQPIHSRTPSTDLKPNDPKKQTESANLSPFNPSLFFEQANKSFTPSTQTGAASQPTDVNAISSLFTPVSSKPLNSFPIQTNSPILTSLSNLPPPSAVPPPLSKATTSSNPYAAKGALNKKVYDNVIPIAPIPNSNTTPAIFLNPVTNENIQAQQIDMFTPLAKSGSNTSLAPSFNNQPMFNPENIQQPMVNLEQRMTSSMSLNFDNSASLHSYQPVNQSVNQSDTHQNPQQQQNWWNRFTQNKLVNTFVEKAKYGVETIVTTVDPQMKEYIHPANRPFYIVSSIANHKLLNTIRESFGNAGFSKLTLTAHNAQNSSAYAPQIVGFPCALQSAKEKLENTLYQMQQTPDCVVISFQDFLAELTTDCWYEIAVIMLKDKTNNIDLTIYTEAIPVSNEDIGQLKQYTPSDFNLQWSGFSVRLPEKNFNFNATNSTSSNFLNYETQETVLSQARLSHALNTLAILFKNKLLAQIKQ